MATDYAEISDFNVKQLGLDTKSRKSQVNMYSDSTHFIFEILQNADDYGATEISFKLESNQLIIEHNGVPFNQENVKAITYFGKSTSADDLVKTGRFGIGFKSVFAFTATPIVLSGEEQFQIYDLYKLRPYTSHHNRQPERTYIILPFNHTEFTPDFVETHLSAKEAYRKIAKRLKDLDKKTILFTKNLQIIEWETQENKSFYSREDQLFENYRVSSITDDLRRTDSRFLVFAKDVKWEQENGEQQFKPVEVAFYLNEESQIIPGPSFLYVLFSTIQETHLKFIINGPFRTNPSRESIAHDDPFNLQLLKLVEEMWPKILGTLKAKDFLSIKALNTLPNDSDDLPSFYEPIRTRIIELFKDYEYLPAEDGSYVSAGSGVTGPNKLKQLFSNGDLSFLSEEGSFKWLKNPPSNSRAARFIRSLNIKSWGWEDLVEVLEEGFSEPRSSWYVDEDEIAQFKRNCEWLLRKDAGWLQRFYIELAKACESGNIERRYNYRTRVSTVPFEDSHIIVIKNTEGLSTQSISDSKFPKDGYEGCVADSILQHENEEIKMLVRESLEALGVTEINEEDEIKILLAQKYSGDVQHEINGPWIKEHLQDLKRFATYFLENDDTSIYNGYHFLLISEGDELESPVNIYIDNPFIHTGLNELYACDLDEVDDKSLLYPIYADIYSDSFESFLRSLGVQFELVIRKTSTSGNPQRDNLRSFYGSRETDTKIDRDYKIEHLSVILEARKVSLAKLVYEAVRKADPEVLTARFRPNQEWSIKTAPSQLVHILSTLSWMPTKSGEFKEPRFVTESILHGDFEFDNSNGWLEAIGFDGSLGHDEEDEEIALKRGYSSAEEMNDWDKLRSEARERGVSLEDMRRGWMKDKPERPVSDPTNIQSARKETRQGYKQSPNKSYSPKARVTRDNSTNQERKQYLMRLNSNSLGEMICQLCHEVMPFKYNGEYYFEAVEILARKRLPKEYFKQYLALCPNCSAKYKLYIKQDERKLEDLAWAIKELIIANNPDEVGDELEIPLELDVEAVLWFTKTQIIDLKAILEDQPD